MFRTVETGSICVYVCVNMLFKNGVCRLACLYGVLSEQGFVGLEACQVHLENSRG